MDKRLVSICILFLTIAPFASWASCTPRPSADLTMTILDNGSIVVPIKLHGTPVFMQFMLNAPLTLLSERAVERFKLPTLDYPKDGMKIGGQSVRGNAKVDALEIGDVRYGDQYFMIDPFSNSAWKYPTSDVVGTLGIDLLWKMDIELDMAHSSLKLYAPNQCPDRGAYWSDSYNIAPLRRSPLGEIYFPMELDGRKIEAAFSTTSVTTTLTTDVTKRVYGFDKHSPGVQDEYRAMKLTSSSLVLTDEKVKLLDPPASDCVVAKKMEAVGYENCFGIYPLQLGRSVLAKMRIYIATREDRLYFTVN